MLLLRVAVALALMQGRFASGSAGGSGSCAAECSGGLLREGQCAPAGPAGPGPQFLWKGTHSRGNRRRALAFSVAAIGARGGAWLLRGGSGETAETQALRFGTLSPVPSPARRHLNLQLWEASRRGLQGLLAGLVQQGAEVDAAFEARDGTRKNALHFATLSGQRGAVLALLQAGADVTCVDDEENMALHMAAAKGDLPMVQLLVEMGSPLETYNADIQTPRSEAKERGHTEVAEFLAAIEPSRAENDGEVLESRWATGDSVEEGASEVTPLPNQVRKMFRIMQQDTRHAESSDSSRE